MRSIPRTYLAKGKDLPCSSKSMLCLLEVTIADLLQGMICSIVKFGKEQRKIGLEISSQKPPEKTVSKASVVIYFDKNIERAYLNNSDQIN